MKKLILVLAALVSFGALADVPTWNVQSIRLEDGRSIMGLMYDEGKSVEDDRNISGRLYEMKILCDGGTKAGGYKPFCWIEKSN